MKVGVKGYYGYGNLGDDILMLSSIDIVKSILPNSNISIITESKNPNYILSWLPDIDIVTSNEIIHFDLIIHGGGGTYFDFKSSGSLYKLINKVIHILGYSSYSRIYNLYRKLISKGGVTTQKRIGLGIGVGTFTESSSKFYYSILTLTDFHYLFVRDNDSLRNLEQYNFNYNIFKSTDIAFNTKSWITKEIKEIKKNNVIGFILRDWVYDKNEYLNNIFHTIDNLVKQNFELRFFSFDKRADKFYIDRIKEKFDIEIWDPQDTMLDSFLNKLNECKVMISSRAHGAIVSACLGIPGICIEIEPKLKTIVDMLPNSYILLPKYSENLDQKIFHVLDNYNTFKSNVAKDVSENAIELRKSLEMLESIVH